MHGMPNHMMDRSRRGHRVLAVGLWIGLAVACAQPVPVKRSPPTRTPALSPADPACVGRVTGRRDTLAAAVYASVGFDRSAPAAVREFRNDVLRALVARYSPPDRISAPMTEAAAFPSKVVTGLFAVGPLFDGELLVVFDGNGRVQETRVVEVPDSPDLMPALIAAVHRTDSARAFPSLPAGARDTRTPVRIRLFGTRSTVPPPTDSSATVVTIAEPRFLVSVVEDEALAISGSGQPRYPSELKSQGIQGKVWMQFVVDVHGRADIASARTVFATHPDFARTVMQAMPEMRFIPGLIGGCPVPSWVRQAFEFRLGG